LIFCAAPLGLDLCCSHFCGGLHHRLCYAARSGLLKRIIIFVAKHKLTALVIARSGYTTIMDLHQIGRRAILFPTKGQWEQEYLAKRYRG